jgi:hypothetical protein
MPHHDIVALSGVVMNVFVHLFTIKAEGKMHLADLGPKGAEAFPPTFSFLKTRSVLYSSRRRTRRPGRGCALGERMKIDLG